MRVPAIFGSANQKFVSVEREPLLGFDGSEVAETSVTPPMMVRRLARAASDRPTIRASELLEICGRAAAIFAEGEPDGLTPEAYVQHTCLTTGLPVGVIHESSLRFFPELLRGMDRVLEAQSPAGLGVFDTGTYSIGDIEVALAPRGRNVGFVMPGNHPSTHALWLIALATRMPVLLRPSSADVFTPYRLTMSLLEAGLPENLLYLLPGGHDLVDAIVRSASLTVVFGGQAVLDAYGGDPRVKVYGPGRSKALVCADADLDQAAETVCRLMMDDAGLGCINCSAVAVQGDARKLAAKVAERLEKVPPLNPLAEGARLPAAGLGEVRGYEEYLSSRSEGAEDLIGGALIRQVEGAHVLRPAVVLTGAKEHPLFGVELPFPFAVFASVPSREALLEAARGSLAAVVVGGDEAFVRDLLLEPSVHKVYAEGALSTEFDPAEPHEGYLVDFLFERKAFRRSPPSSLTAVPKEVER